MQNFKYALERKIPSSQFVEKLPRLTAHAIGLLALDQEKLSMKLLATNLEFKSIGDFPDSRMKKEFCRQFGSSMMCQLSIYPGGQERVVACIDWSDLLICDRGNYHLASYRMRAVSPAILKALDETLERLLVKINTDMIYNWR